MNHLPKSARVSRPKWVESEKSLFIFGWFSEKGVYIDPENPGPAAKYTDQFGTRLAKFVFKPDKGSMPTGSGFGIISKRNEIFSGVESASDVSSVIAKGCSVAVSFIVLFCVRLIDLSSEVSGVSVDSEFDGMWLLVPEIDVIWLTGSFLMDVVCPLFFDEVLEVEFEMVFS